MADDIPELIAEARQLAASDILFRLVIALERVTKERDDADRAQLIERDFRKALKERAEQAEAKLAEADEDERHWMAHWVNRAEQAEAKLSRLSGEDDVEIVEGKR